MIKEEKIQEICLLSYEARGRYNPESEKEFLREAEKLKNPSLEILNRIFKANNLRSSVVYNFIVRKIAGKRSKNVNFWKRAEKIVSTQVGRINIVKTTKNFNDLEEFIRKESMGSVVYVMAIEKALRTSSNSQLLRLADLTKSKIPPGTPWYFNVWKEALRRTPKMKTKDLKAFLEKNPPESTKEAFEKGIRLRVVC